MASPRVSIIIPVYNREKLVIETLESIQNQTFNDFECIIVDDGSTDNTVGVITDFIRNDNRFKLLIRPKNLPKGANTCRNFGFEHSKGEYVKWFDSDDIMLPDFIHKQVKFLDDHPEMDFVSSFYYRNSGLESEIIKPNTQFDPEFPLYSYFLENLFFSTPGPLWRSYFLKKFSLAYPLNIHRGQEAFLHIDALSHTHNFHFIEEPLFIVKKGHDSIEKQWNKDPVRIESVVKFYIYAFNRVIHFDTNQNKKKARLLAYLFHRASTTYALLLQVSKQKRFKIFKLYYPQLNKMSNQVMKRDFILKFRLFVGSISLLAINKGYSFFYFHKFKKPED